MLFLYEYENFVAVQKMGCDRVKFVRKILFLKGVGLKIGFDFVINYDENLVIS